MPIKPNYPIEKVTWLDAHGGTNQWQNMHDIEAEPKTVTSIGFVTNESDAAITVTPHYDHATDSEVDFACGALVIPKGCIVNRKKLR